MADSGLRDKVPPSNLEAEKATLGAVFINSSSLLTVLDYLRPDDFYKNAHKKIFQAMLNLDSRNENVDILTVNQELKNSGDLDSAGGAAYVASLTSEVPTSANVEYYAKIVQEASVRRSLINTASEIISGAFDDTNGTGQVIEDAERKIFEITEKSHVGSYRSVRELVSDAVSSIEKRMMAKADCIGVPSGYTDLDSLTNGFQPSDFIVIGARPSVGKTALALSMAANMAIRKNIKVGFFSLEQDANSIMQRLLAGESRVNSRSIRSGFLSEIQLEKLMDSANRIYENMPLFICDTPGMRLLDLRTEARRMKSKEDIDVIFIDYIGLIGSENKLIPRHEQVAEISRSLKELARELKIPVIVLSQVKREVGSDKPTLADLRESGSIEQDADLVMFLHRGKQNDKDDDGADPDRLGKEIDVIVAKNRNGPVGEIKLMFLPAYTRFESVSRDKE